MTTAHRPTFDPARGKEAQRGPAYHQRLLPAHTQLKTRQAGQGGDADPQVQDLRTQLLQAEAAHFKKSNPNTENTNEEEATTTSSAKRQLEDVSQEDADGEEDLDAKRRRILEETRDVDAASDSEGESSSEDSDDEEDETADLLRELEKIKRERAEKKEQEASALELSARMYADMRVRNVRKPPRSRTRRKRT